MEPNTNPKIRFRIITLTIAVQVLIILIAVIAVNGLSKMVEINENIGESVSRSNYDLQQMQLSFGKMRVAVRDFALDTVLSDNEKTMEGIETSIKDFEASLAQYERSLNEYTVPLDYEIDIVKAAVASMQEYRYAAVRVMEAGMANDMDAVKIILTEQEEVLSREVTDRLQASFEFQLSRTYEMSARSHHSGNSVVVMVIICAVIAVTFLFAASIFAISALNKAFNDRPYIQDKVGGSNDEGLLLSEFGKCISELKVVTYDLTKLMKERR